MYNKKESINFYSINKQINLTFLDRAFPQTVYKLLSFRLIIINNIFNEAN